MADHPDRYKRGVGVLAKDMSVCGDCGVVVYDETLHDQFHATAVAVDARVARWLGPPDVPAPHA